MTMQGFPHTMRELSDRFKAERERLESERSQYFPAYSDPLLEETLGDLRRNAEREDRIVSMWAWTFAAIVIGGLIGLSVYFLPIEYVLGVGLTLLTCAAVGGCIVWYDSRKYPSGGRL